MIDNLGIAMLRGKLALTSGWYSAVVRDITFEALGEYGFAEALRRASPGVY